MLLRYACSSLDPKLFSGTQANGTWWTRPTPDASAENAGSFGSRFSVELKSNDECSESGSDDGSIGEVSAATE